MKNRIVELRKELKLSQGKFAEQLNLTRNFVSLVETGDRKFSDRTIADICRVYGVNETWLLTGEGEMFAPMDREQEIAQLTASIIKENNPIRFKLQKIVANLTEDQLEMIYEKAKELVEENLPE